MLNGALYQSYLIQSKGWELEILIAGMSIAVYVSSDIGSPVYSLILAQASSILAVPLIAIGLLLIANRKDVMGKYKNTPFQNILAIIGFVLTCVLVYIMYIKLIGYFTNTNP